MNKVIVLGRLGSDPDSKSLMGGSACFFTVATSEKWKDTGGNQQERTEWHKVSAFGKLADICSKYLTKGSQVLVEGKIRTREWQDKDNQKRYTTEIIADNVQFLGSKKENRPQETEDDGIPY